MNNTKVKSIAVVSIFVTFILLLSFLLVGCGSTQKLSKQEASQAFELANLRFSDSGSQENKDTDLLKDYQTATETEVTNVTFGALLTYAKTLLDKTDYELNDGFASVVNLQNITYVKIDYVENQIVFEYLGIDAGLVSAMKISLDYTNGMLGNMDFVGTAFTATVTEPEFYIHMQYLTSTDLTYILKSDSDTYNKEQKNNVDYFAEIAEEIDSTSIENVYNYSDIFE